MPKKYTMHGKKRADERINSNIKTTTIINNAKKYGKCIENYNGDFYNYLKSKRNSTVTVKVYCKSVFIFGKNNNKLITTYPIPKRYFPIEQYELPQLAQALISNINSLRAWQMEVEFKDGTKKTGYLRDCEVKSSNKTINFTLVRSNNKRKVININDVKSIKICEEIFSEDLKLKYLQMVENINENIETKKYEDIINNNRIVKRKKHNN